MNTESIRRGRRRSEDDEVALVLVEYPRHCGRCKQALAETGGGICRQCGERLCFRHLHGRMHWFRRLARREPVCLKCRKKG